MSLPNSLAMSKYRKLVLIVLVILVAGVSFYLFDALVAGAGYPPFCSGYPPGGDCHANYSYTFTLGVNYSGPWELSFRGFHNSEIVAVDSDQNYTGANYRGNGSMEITRNTNGGQLSLPLHLRDGSKNGFLELDPHFNGDRNE